jgi:excisionase family DNA binding protein
MTLLSGVMTVDELAAYLKVHPSTIYRLLRRKGLPGFKIGSDWRFTTASIEEWIQTQPTRSVTQ